MPLRAPAKAAAALALIALCAAFMINPASAQDSEGFYKGKTVDVYAGASPGSGYDGYARIIARHIGRFIPGAPNVVVKNMPAASGLALANFLYNQAPRDGLVFAIIHNNLTVEPLIGNKNARFDAAKFGWVGSASKLNKRLRHVAFAAASHDRGFAPTRMDHRRHSRSILDGATGAYIHGAWRRETESHPRIRKHHLDDHGA